MVGWVLTLKLMLSQPKLKLELELGLSLAISNAMFWAVRITRTFDTYSVVRPGV